MKVILLLGLLAALQSVQCKPFISFPAAKAHYAQDSNGKNVMGNILKLASCVLPKITNSGDKIDTSTSKPFDFSKILSAVLQCGSSLNDFLGGLSPKEKGMNDLAVNELAQELENEKVAQEEEAGQEIAEEQFWEDLAPMLIRTVADKFADKISREG